MEIIGQEMVTDMPSTFSKSAAKLVGYDMSRIAAERLYKNTGMYGKELMIDFQWEISYEHRTSIVAGPVT